MKRNWGTETSFHDCWIVIDPGYDVEDGDVTVFTDKDLAQEWRDEMCKNIESKPDTFDESGWRRTKHYPSVVIRASLLTIN